VPRNHDRVRLPRLRAALALAAIALALAACEKLFAPARGPFNGVDVTGGGMGGPIQLADHSGKVRTLADFRGKVVVVVFGFTHCPDVCPTTLADMASAVNLLGEYGNQVQVLFVTVDPKRDTAEVLRQYVPAFHAKFIGLRGSAAETEGVTKAFHVYASERAGKTPETYTVDHSAQSFVIDREGRLRLLIPPATKPAAIASDLKILINS
jgi:protein SCO1/2